MATVTNSGAVTVATETPVPATAVFNGGIAHTPSGAMYVVGGDGNPLVSGVTNALTGETRVSSGDSFPISIGRGEVVPQAMRWGVIGDSIIANNFSNAAATATTVSDGVVTCNVGTSTGFVVGALVSVSAATTAAGNIVNGIVTVAAANTCTIVAQDSMRSVQTGSASLHKKQQVAGVFGWLSFLCKKPFVYEWMAAGGARTPDITSMVEQWMDLNPTKSLDAFIISAAGNDIYSESASATTVIDRLKTLFVSCAKLGCPGFVLTVPPRTYVDATKRDTHFAVNAWIMRNAPVYGITPQDTWSAAWNGEVYVAPYGTSANGEPTSVVASYGWSTDGQHPGAKGSAAIAAKIFPNLSAIQADPPRAFRGVLESGNFLTNPDFSASSGAAGSVIVTGYTWATSGGSVTRTRDTVARTVAADGDTCGYNVSLDLSNAGGSGSNTYTFSFDSVTGLTPGAEYTLSLRAKITNPVYIGQMIVDIWITLADSSILAASHAINLTNSVLSATYDGEFFVPKVQLPAGATNIKAQIRMSTVDNVAAQTYVIVFAQPQFRDALEM